MTYHGVSFVVRNYYRNATTRSTKRPQVARLLIRAEGGQVTVTALKFCGTIVRHACPRMSVATAAATQPAPSIPLPHRALASFDTTRFVEGNRGVPALVAHYPCRRLVRRAARVLAICRPRERDRIRGARDHAARCNRADRWYRAGCRHACGAHGAYGKPVARRSHPDRRRVDRRRSRQRRGGSVRSSDGALSVAPPAGYAPA